MTSAVMKPNRHLTRQAVFQSLFEADFRQNDPHLNWSRLVKELGQSLDVPFGESLLYCLVENSAKIDEAVLRAAPNWPMEKVAKVDKAVLRLAVAELLFHQQEDTPPRVVINEAVVLAKKFGSDSSFRFVNGVLATIYKSIQ